jgi:hypothetical protein
VARGRSEGLIYFLKVASTTSCSPKKLLACVD